MPKIEFICDLCSAKFAVWPAAIRYAEKRGHKVRFCSSACRLQARRGGLIEGKKVRGAESVCEICGHGYYLSQSRIKAGKRRFCSHPCRVQAEKEKLIIRPSAKPSLLRGETITCKICGTERYRKQSMLDRRISQTCGKRDCVSAYGRSLWGLQPNPNRVQRGRGERRYEVFTAAQRVAWLDSKCAKCGSTRNLTLDHIVAVVCGGKSVKENAQTLCGTCNNIKCRLVDLPLARQQAQSGGQG